MANIKSQYRLRFASETHRMTTIKISERKLNTLLKSASQNFEQWQKENFGELLPGYVLTVLTSDGYPIRSTTDGKNWTPCAAQPFFTSLR